MSSTSSSASNLPRTPLHERSDSENNKLQIRMVPYSPPRPLDDEDNSRLSHPEEQSEQTEGEEDVQSATGSATITTPRTPKATTHGRRGYGAESSRSQSFSSPISPATGVKSSDVSGSKLASGSGGVEHTAPQTPVINTLSYGSNIKRINPQSQPSPSRHDDGPARPRRGTVSRRENYISVHADKTFSIVLRPTQPRRSDRSGSITKSPPLSNVSTNVSTISSHEESSFDASTEDRHGSPLSSALERSISPNTSGSPSTITALPEEVIEPSPFNYRMVGGLRRVPITPDPKGKGKQRELSESPLPPLPVTTASSPEPSSPLATKQSFNSEESASTIEETTNYKVIGRSSPPLPDTASIEVPSSSSSANYKVIGQSSPAHTLASTAGPAFADTPASKNYIVYGDTSSVASSGTPFRGHRYHHSDDSSQRKVREKYSQESLLVPPLRPHKRSSSESFGYPKQRSGDNLRGRTNSFSSLSSIVSHDTGSLFTGSTPNVVLLRHTPSASSIPQPTYAEPSSAAQQKALMDTHQWSSQLSTVMSEYEGSDPGSRGASAGSMGDRVSSLLGSRDSRHMRSISSSLVLENLETRLSHSRSHSQSDSLDRPGAVYSRGGLSTSSPRMIRDHDEHGDGLADLQHLQHRSSRTRLGFSRQASDRSLRSSASSRSRAGSLVASSFPSWARLYYSSPDRRWLMPLSRSPSEVSDTRPTSPWIGGGSPSHDQYAHPIYNPRRRPREIDPHGHHSDDSMEIAPVVETGDMQRTPKKKSSSLWSPHLRLDTRASNFSMWNAPSITWSADTGVFGRRNIQVVLFVMGFLFPFAWMIAAFLPLPPKPTLAMEEGVYSKTRFPTSSEVEPPQGRLVFADDARYQSARWWRNINRFMAVAGLIIVGAVVALVVVGVRERWGRQ
ncbi:hypothetical protein F4774DRAFT_150841 [Daldinia eschscholtzii]|nr:hypothetical protein F4774DRAFT_150841 [Daldinia eschscholtzii]